MVYSIISGPVGMKLHASSGILTWTPVAVQRPSTNTVSVRIADSYSPSGSATQNFTVIAVNTDDVTRPTVAFTAPTDESRSTNVTWTITGTAGDNRAVSRVLVSLNGDTFADATGTMAWSFDVNPLAGTNTVAVKSIDTSGNESTVATRTFFRVVNAPITVNTVGYGLVTPDVNGLMLEVGRTYTLTAVPFQDHWFTNWTGSVEDTNLSFTFTMASNLTFTATFVTNQFVAAAGVYNGLYSDTNGVEHASAGFLTLKLDKKRGFSAKVIGGGGTYSLVGAFDLAGDTTVVVPRNGKNSLIVQLHVDLAGGTESLSGRVTDGVWESAALADRAVTTAATAAGNFTGRYTMVLPGAANAAVAPAGNGYGVVSVAANGTVALTGGNTDASATKQAVTISKDGYWPFYVALYPGNYVYTNGFAVVTNREYQGCLIGWVQFATNAATALSGNVANTKNAMSDSAYYPAGFTHEAEIWGSAYTPPAAGQAAVTVTNGLLLFQDGNLAAPVQQDSASVTAQNAVAVPLPNPLQISFRVTPKTGLIKGTFVPPGETNKVTVTGAVLQNLHTASGCFLGASESGSMNLQNHSILNE
jgi:hypothetical protein